MALLGAALAGGVLALLVAHLAISRTGIYFVMLTFCVQPDGFLCRLHLERLDGGDYGLLSVPRRKSGWVTPCCLSLADARAFYGLSSVLFC